MLRTRLNQALTLLLLCLALPACLNREPDQQTLAQRHGKDEICPGCTCKSARYGDVSFQVLENNCTLVGDRCTGTCLLLFPFSVIESVPCEREVVPDGGADGGADGGDGGSDANDAGDDGGDDGGNDGGGNDGSGEDGSENDSGNDGGDDGTGSGLEQWKLYSVHHYQDKDVRRDPHTALKHFGGQLQARRYYGLGVRDTPATNDYWDFVDYDLDGVIDPGENRFPVLYNRGHSVGVDVVRFASTVAPVAGAAYEITGTFPDGTVVTKPAVVVGPFVDKTGIPKWYAQADPFNGTEAATQDQTTYHPSYVINWKLKVTIGQLTSNYNGTSRSRIYVAGHPLDVAKEYRFETTIHVGTVAADGAHAHTPTSDVLIGIWNKFATRVVQSVDEDGYSNPLGVVMTYYGPSPTASPQFAGVLGDYTGDCAAWMYLTSDAMALQTGTTPSCVTIMALPGQAFVVTDGAAPPVKSPGQGASTYPPAQSTEPAGFNQHCVLTVWMQGAHNLIDPSYGRKATGTTVANARNSYWNTFVRDQVTLLPIVQAPPAGVCSGRVDL